MFSLRCTVVWRVSEEMRGTAKRHVLWSVGTWGTHDTYIHDPSTLPLVCCSIVWAFVVVWWWWCERKGVLLKPTVHLCWSVSFCSERVQNIPVIYDPRGYLFLVLSGKLEGCRCLQTLPRNRFLCSGDWGPEVSFLEWLWGFSSSPSRVSTTDGPHKKRMAELFCKVKISCTVVIIVITPFDIFPGHGSFRPLDRKMK